MNYILIAESLILLFFLCRTLEALANAVTRPDERKPLKIDFVKPKKWEQSEQERKDNIMFENIENYGTDKPQKKVE